ncbi:excalibur calcium-binding domain-containing protein [Bacillus cytotoxicus]|uniref:excalibur calcium-binding domain-containing protein n=1 Tax=Bacillus cereus group sp. BfR-BA-01492 TaxID=2920361 RepID=UPI001F572513|nr:excalibur calcium-binding domain-containing protein [Bacillus cereus group sp. BfR-BA-01492]EMA6343819.1 excalibur calcium-binding domain-containing protein [Bacillus cytotoxicus]
MKKLLASASAFVLLTIGFNSPAFAAKSPNDTKNCGHFKSQQEAQEFWNQNGYGVGNDPHRLDRDKDGIPCEDYKYPASTNATTEKKETSKKEESTKQEQTNTQKQATKKETKQNTNTNTDAKKDSKKQGEKLPNTASNNVTMMLASLGLALAGSVLMFRRKKTNA